MKGKKNEHRYICNHHSVRHYHRFTDNYSTVYMTEDKITLFKLELRTLPILQRKREQIQQKYDEVVYMLEGVKGVDTAKEPTHTAHDIRLLLIERKDAYEAQLCKLSERIDDIYRKLNNFSKPMQRILLAVYCDRVPVTKVAEKYGYSESTLRRLINKHIYTKIDSHDA